MKKVISGTMTLILTLMGLVALSFASIVPASADMDLVNTNICHYTPGGGGKYEQILVSKHSIVKKTNHFGGHGQDNGTHDKDIIPPFPYNFGGEDHGTYSYDGVNPGKNWTPENEALWGHGTGTLEKPGPTGCEPFGNPLTPNVPLSPQATCVQQFPPLAETAQPAGVTYTAELDKKTAEYTVTFAIPADTTYQTYWLTDGFKKPITVPILPAGPSDIYWDDTKGACNLPDTGLFGLSTEATIGGGALLALGLLFVIGNAVTRRNA
jgi:hypothetical protein